MKEDLYHKSKGKLKENEDRQRKINLMMLWIGRKTFVLPHPTNLDTELAKEKE